MEVQGRGEMVSTERRGVFSCFESWYFYHSGDLGTLKPWPPTLVKERNDEAIQTPASFIGVFRATPLWKAAGNVLWMGSSVLPPMSQIVPAVIVRGNRRAYFGMFLTSNFSSIQILERPPGIVDALTHIFKGLLRRGLSHPK